MAKTKTSTTVKDRYNKQHYITIGANLDKELVARFRARLAERGDKAADVFRNAITAYIREADIKTK
jgi:hypothetical protein